MGENGKKWRAGARRTIGHDETKANLMVVIKDESIGNAREEKRDKQAERCRKKEMSQDWSAREE